MDRLRNGTNEEKLGAIAFIGKHGVKDAVPLLVENVDNENRGMTAVYVPKGGYASISCAATTELEFITGLFNQNFDEGNTCGNRDPKGVRDIGKIKTFWKDWYKNDYQNWLKSK